MLTEEARRLPAELAKIDAYLDDDRFLAPWRALFDRRLGRPSVPVDTLLRLLYLEHRYGLGYESLCPEVADSLSWRLAAASAWRGRCRTDHAGQTGWAAPGAAWAGTAPGSRSVRATADEPIEGMNVGGRLAWLACS